MKSPSSELSKEKKTSPVRSNEKESNGNHKTKNTKKKNMNLVKEDKSRKRKRAEEKQKKPKSTGTKSASNASKRKKENKVVANNSNSAQKTATNTKPSSSKGAKASANSVKGSKSLKPEQGKMMQAENGTAKKLKQDSRNSVSGFVLALQKPETTAKCRTSSSSKEEAGSSRSNVQIKVNFEGKTWPNSSLSRASSAALKGKSKALSARQMKVMRALGLAPPVGSPFVRPEIL